MGSPKTNGREGIRETPWTVHIQAAYDALAQKNVKAAVRAWDEAHLVAIGSGRWEGLIEAGDAYLRIGEASGCRKASEATVRKAYFAALYRACQRGSFDGVLRTAGAFADLGDRQVVEECVGLAELLADDDHARARVRAFLARVTAQSVPADTLPEGLAVAPVPA